ncbi:ATP-binding cassette subfamily B protein [Entomoplasma freundtii]|uniref:ABC transporter ATP-binding protein/permease n=1 Tax=Entomoplasma freundtii TaxID=74700 RepID=A0A2K8NQZ7_9MOLU|nr:ABC transporter ATP-binding protein [Entomoplasma freundtii]ATZ16275.1 ABC transporter ATP-binding protein/permease [Entomoplasma freundtii]TDY56824.1 ATP-binding cassette subfamily B protein [Entomoplasma freundtii]
MNFFKLLLTYSKKYPIQFGFLIYFIISNAIFIASISFLTNIVIKQAIYDYDPNQGHNYGMVWWGWLLVTFGVLIILGFGTFMKDYLGNIIGAYIEVGLRNQMVSRLLNQDISYYSNKKIGELMTKIINDTGVIGAEINGLLSSIIQAPLVLIFGTISLFLIDPLLAGVATVLIYSMAFSLVLIVKSYRKHILKTRTIMTHINGDITDKIGAIKLVKSSGTRIYEENRINSIHEPYVQAYKPVAKTGASLITVLTVSDVIVSLVVISVATLVYGMHQHNVVKLMANVIPIVSGLTALTRPLWQISGIIPGLARASASTERIQVILQGDPLLTDNYGKGKRLRGGINTIEMNSIAFRYPENPNRLVIPKTSLIFEKGKSYAFVGETGSGKTTISKLLLRFYDPTDGQVIINNQDLRNYDLSSYLRFVGYVEQEPQIIYGDVYDNVRYGTFNSRKRDVIEACKKANIHHLIESWPNGYHTILGERGLLLSGGQKQRLIIARIILKNPDLLILDEATSSLDNIVEKEIQKELDKLMEKKTTIIIAHRLSTIKKVNHIYVLGADGEGIIQSGTFDELIGQPGTFKSLWDAGFS